MAKENLKDKKERATPDEMRAFQQACPGISVFNKRIKKEEKKKTGNIEEIFSKRKEKKNSVIIYNGNCQRT